MKISRLPLLILFSILSSYCPVVGQTDSTAIIFQKKLADAKLSFNKPQHSTDVPKIAGSPVKYEYAVTLRDQDVEIRYSIWPLSQKTFDAYARRKKKQGDTILYPNNVHNLLAKIIFSQISGGKISDSQVKLNPYTPEISKKEFGADSGYMFMGPVGKKYSDKYTFGFFVVLHRDFVGNAFISYLFLDEKAMFDQMTSIAENDGIFKALKFNE